MALMGFRSKTQEKAAAFFRANLGLQQFGQSGDNEVHNGATACTHTMLQSIYQFVTGKRITLNEVNRLAGMPKNATASVVVLVRGHKRVVQRPRGMRQTEVVRFIKATKLPYELLWDQPFQTILDRSELGPVMYPMRYGSAPTQKGAKYNGVRAKAPFAIHRGRTQLAGFEDGRHAVLYVGTRTVRSKSGRFLYARAYRKEPNHGSPVRKERPPFDIIRATQSQREYYDYRDRLHQRLWVLVPTRKVK